MNTTDDADLIETIDMSSSVYISDYGYFFRQGHFVFVVIRGITGVVGNANNLIWQVPISCTAKTTIYQDYSTSIGERFRMIATGRYLYIHPYVSSFEYGENIVINFSYFLGDVTV